MRQKPLIHSMPLEIIDVPVPNEPSEIPASHAASPAGATRSSPDPILVPDLDLGPNGPAVRELLSRAERLSKAERHRLAEVAQWRWWPLTLPVGGSSAGARATAIVRARGAGRAGALQWIEARAAATAGERIDGRRSIVVRATANAALALLARDVIDEDVFDALYGPWREVTHR